MWKQHDSGRVGHRFEWIVVGAVLALVPVLVIETHVSHVLGKLDLSSRVQLAAEAARRAAVAVP